MNGRFGLAAIFATTVFGCLSTVRAIGSPPPAEAYAQRPAMTGVDLNPSGTRLAWVEDTGTSTRVVIHDLISHMDLRTLNAPKELRLYRVSWADDDTLLIHESSTQAVEPGGRHAAEFFRWVAVSVAGGQDRLLLMNGGDRRFVTGAALVKRRTTKPGKVFMSTLDFSATDYKQETGSRLTGGRKDMGWISNLYEVDLKSGDGRILASGTPYTTDWETDESGEHVVRSEYNPKYGTYGIYAKDGTGWREIYKSTGCGDLKLFGLTATGDAALALGNPCGSDHGRIVALPLDGSTTRILAEDAKFDVDNAVVDPYDDNLIGYDLNGDDEGTRWLNPQTEKRIAALRKSFGGSGVWIVARSANNRRIVAETSGASIPSVYYFIDFDAKTADIINEQYPKLAGVKTGEVRVFNYQARDKYPLIAYLTLPPGGGDKNLPVVVMPHGGPNSRDYLAFDWLSQFLASRGYAVLQPQFRGSTGFGQAHEDAGRRQWGLRMQDDVSDALGAIVEQGIADPKRACIVGWSYGGYSALAGAAFTPELYVCAASIAGVSDLPTMLGYEAMRYADGAESDTSAHWRDNIGSPSDPQVIAKSPAHSAATIRAPILLLHGTDDTVVPIAQSRIMAQALDAAHKPYEFVELPGDDHDLLTSNTRVKMATELEKFLAKYLGGAAETAASTSH